MDLRDECEFDYATSTDIRFAVELEGLVRAAVDLSTRRVLILDKEHPSNEFLELKERYLTEKMAGGGKQLVTLWDYEGKNFDDKLM